MPFGTESSAVLGQQLNQHLLNTGDVSEVLYTDNPTFKELFGASIIKDTSLGALVTGNLGIGYNRLFGAPTEQGINYFERAVNSGFDPSQSEDFFYAKTEQDYVNIAKGIETENLASETLANGGFKGILAGFMAQAVDPINLIGAGVTVKALGATTNIATRAIGGAAVGAATGAAQQIPLEVFQATHGFEETAKNITANAFLSGVMGAAGAVGLKLISKDKIDNIAEHLNNPAKETTIPDNLFEPRSIGAAQVQEVTKEQQSLYVPDNAITGTLFRGISKVQETLSPTMRLLNSQSLEIRKLVEKLTSVAPELQKNTEGLATDVGTISSIHTWDKDLSQSIAGIDNAYKSYRKQLKGSDKLLSKDEFEELVSEAYEGKVPNITGDAMTDKFIGQAVDSASILLSKITRESKSLGMIAKDVPDGAMTWLTHQFVPEKVLANLDRAKQVFRDSFAKQFDKEVFNAHQIIRAFDSGQQIDDTALNLAKETISINDYGRDQYLDESVNKTIKNLLGRDSAVEAIRFSPNDRGVFKDRTINLPFRDISFMMERRISRLVERSGRVSVPEIELTRKFGTSRFSLDAKEFQNINTEIDDILAKAKPEDRIKLREQLDSDIHDLSSMFNMVRGTYKSRTANYNDWVSRSLAAFRNLTYITTMGKAVISSLADPIIIGRTHGYGKVLGTYFSRLLDTEFRKFTKEEVKSIGKGLNTVMANRLVANYELGDPLAKGSALERFLFRESKRFGNISLLNQWTDLGESVSYSLNSDKLINTLYKNSKGTLSDKDERWLSSFGIGKDIRHLVLNEIKQHSRQFDNGLTLFQTERWSDKELARLVDSALNKKVSQEVVTKTIGDVPIALEGDIGKFITQFMSFGLAATNKIVLTGLQNVDAKYLTAELALIMLGAAQYGVKLYLADKEIPKDPEKLIMGAFSQHPELSLPMFVHDKGAALGLWNQSDLKRAAPSDAISSFLGANVTTAKRIVNTGRAAVNTFTDQPVTKGQLNDATKLIPYNNLFYTQKLVNHMRDKLDKQLIEE